jgi:glycosyltransferase involved in cell wall biosynthesis
MCKNRIGNILVLAQWSYKDALIQTYTLPYINIIRNLVSVEHRIYLATSEQNKLALSNEELKHVNTGFEQRNIKLIAQKYYPLGLKKYFFSFFQIASLFFTVKRRKITTIHCFCTPAGSMGYLLSVLTGATLIIDSYEPHAEAMVENGTWKKSGLPFKILFFFEKLQSKRAKSFIATSSGMKQYALDRYNIAINNFYVKPACVDLSKFSGSEKNITLLDELDLRDKIVCVYAGKLGGTYLKEEVFDFIFACYSHWGSKFRFLMLTNATQREVEDECNRVGLPSEIVFRKFVLHEKVPQYLSIGDFAINPVRPVPTKRLCTSIKDGEYWAKGLPVVITKDISDDSSIISTNNIGYELQSLSKEEYNKAIIKIEELLTINPKSTLNSKIRSIAVRYRSFDIAANIYAKIYKTE